MFSFEPRFEHSQAGPCLQKIQKKKKSLGYKTLRLGEKKGMRSTGELQKKQVCGSVWAFDKGMLGVLLQLSALYQVSAGKSSEMGRT